jgi:hypothetical protein
VGRERVCTGWAGQVRSRRVQHGILFFNFFLPTSVLDSPVLMGHGSNGLGRGHEYSGSGLTLAGFF